MPVHQIVGRDMHRAFEIGLVQRFAPSSIGGRSAGRTHRWEDSELGGRRVWVTARGVTQVKREPNLWWLGNS